MKKKNKHKEYSIFYEIHEECMRISERENSHVEWKQNMTRANISSEYWNISLKRLKENGKGHTVAYKKVRHYVRHLDEAYKKGIGFAFTGKNGVGKTSFQMIILKVALKKGYSAFYINLSDIFKYIKMGYDYPPVTLELNKILKQTDFLAVGELGKDYHRSGSELYMISEFDSIFRYRRSRNLPTSLDTNMDEEDMENTYGESLWSLFQSRLETVEVKGRDFRKHFQKEEVKQFFRGKK